MEVLGPILAVVAAFVVIWLVLVAIIWLHRPSRDLAMPALRALPDIVRLARNLLRDPRTPRSQKVALGVLIVWIVSPIDLLPEFLPGIGPLDDIVVAAIVLRWVGRRLGEDALRANWSGTSDGFDLVLRLLGNRSRETL